MASFKGLYDKLISIIKTDTVVNSGSYNPVATDIIPVYDYAEAVDSGVSGEKIAPKKFVRVTDLGGGGSPSTETILYSKLSTTNITNAGLANSFTIPAGTIPVNSMLYLECRAFSNTLTAESAWGVNFMVGSVSIGQSGTSTKQYSTMIKLINVNGLSGTNNVVVGPLSIYPDDYANPTSTSQANRLSIDWSIDQTIDLNIEGTLPAGGVTLQMFRIKLATETPMP